MRDNRTLLCASLVLGLLSLLGCEGDQGPAGLPGAGSELYTGDVVLSGGPVGSGNLVVLHALNSDGESVAGLSSGFTGNDGSFEVPTSELVASSQLAFEAIVGDGSYMAFVANTADQEVGPVSHGIFELVSMIVETPGGRSVSDFTSAEINQLVADGVAALQTAGTDLDDSQAVLDQLLLDLGADVADASGGVIGVGATVSAVTVDPPDLLTQIDIFDVDLYDATAELWDIDGDGSIGDGTDDSYDSMFELNIDGVGFPYQTPGTPETQIEDDYEVALGPVIGMSGLDVTRKIFVSQDRGFARFVEILTNNGVATVTVDVRIEGNLGSDESSDLVHYSSSGDMIVDADDVWIASHFDSSDPAVGFFFPGADPYKYEDDVEYEWSGVEVAPGETVTLMHWGFQLTGGPVSDLADRMAALEDAIPADYFAGLTIAECTAGLFVGSAPNIVGEAGAVAPNADVNADNLSSGSSTAGSADSDGSFSLRLKDTSSGDSVQVTASDGTDMTVIVP